MFSNFAWSEMLVIVIVAVIVVGPKDLPAMLRQFGKALGTIKRMGQDFQRQFNDAVKEADLDDLKDLTSTKGFGPLEDAKKTMEDLNDTLNSQVSEVNLEGDAVLMANSEAAKAEKAAAAASKAAAKTAKPKSTATAAKRKAAPKSAAAKSSAAKSSTAKTAARKPAASKAKTTKTAETRKPRAKTAKSAS